jgi:hypothetical protein
MSTGRVKTVVRGRMEDPVVRVIIRCEGWKGCDNPQGNVVVFETIQVPAVGDEFSLGAGPIFDVVERCWCPMGNQGERPWVVYLDVKEKK